MLQPFISLLAFKIPHQIPTLNLKLLYDTHESDLTICTKTRLRENLLPLQFFQCFILDLQKDKVWGQKDGRHRPLNHSHSLSGANKPSVTHGALGPTAFGSRVFKPSVPSTAKITSGKKAYQRSGVIVSVLLYRKKSWLATLHKSLTRIWFISPAIKQLKTMVLPAFSRSETFCWL